MSGPAVAVITDPRRVDFAAVEELEITRIPAGEAESTATACNGRGGRLLANAARRRPNGYLS
jgi:hypothetical protein